MCSIIHSRRPLAEVLDDLTLDEVATVATAEWRGYGFFVELVRSRGQGGVSVAELPDMRNWELKTRNGEPYILRVRVTDQHDRPAGQCHLAWWGDRDAMLQGESIFVVPAHRRKGVASAMYLLAEKVSGVKVRPSAYQTPEGKALWSDKRHFGKAA